MIVMTSQDIIDILDPYKAQCNYCGKYCNIKDMIMFNPAKPSCKTGCVIYVRKEIR